MKRKRLMVLRSIETLFIILNAVAFKSISARGEVAYKFTFDFALITIDPNASEVIINSAVIGYFFSLAATFFYYKHRRTLLIKASLLMSSLGILSFVLETIRFYSMHQFQMVFQAGIILIIIDWYCLKDGAKCGSREMM